MIIEEALKRRYYKEDGVWYKPRNFSLNGKKYFSRQRQFSHICDVCGQETISGQPSYKTCGNSCARRKFVGEKNHQWKNGGITGDGYKYIYVHDCPMSDFRGRIKEHRYIMYKKLGRSLKNDEHVHHINGNKLDNREENLKIVSKSEHMAIHSKIRAKNAPRDNAGRFFKNTH